MKELYEKHRKCNFYQRKTWNNRFPDYIKYNIFLFSYMAEFDYLKKLSKNPQAKTIIMLHGVGSNKDDLFGLADYFDADVNIFSLNGLFDIGYARRAWYHLSYFQGKPIYDTKEIFTAYEYICEFIDYIIATYHVSTESMYLLWFSQGSNMSHYTLTKTPEKLAGIIALSGRYLKETEDLVLQKRESYTNKKVFIWHGNLDEVIRVEAIEDLQKHYESMGISPVVKTYDMPHTIIEEEMREIVEWMK